MKRGFIGAGVGLLCLAAVATVGVAVSARNETQIAMKDLPVAVRAAAEKAVAGGAIKSIVAETEDGEEAYSVEAMVGGAVKEFTFAADGTLLAEEVDVAFAQLPEAVRAAAEKYFGGSRDLHASKEVANSVTTYEVLGRKGGERVSVIFSATGVLLEEEEDGD